MPARRSSSRGGPKAKAAAASAAAASAAAAASTAAGTSTSNSPTSASNAAASSGSLLNNTSTSPSTAAAEEVGGDSGEVMPSMAPSHEAVLTYLRKRGLGGAAIELTRQLHAEKRRKDREAKEAEAAAVAEQKEKEGSKGKSKSKAKKGKKSKKKEDNTMDIDEDDEEDDNNGDGEGRMELEFDEARARNARTALTLATGGGVGYDLDAAPAIALWGCEEEPIGGGGVGNEASTTAGKSGSPRRGIAHSVVGLEDKKAESPEDSRGQEEARKYVRAFTALQTWVLSLPDDAPGSLGRATVESVMRHAKQAAAAEPAAVGKDKDGDGTGAGAEVHVIPPTTASATAAKSAETTPPTAAAAAAAAAPTAATPSRPYSFYPTAPHIAPSSKPELMTVTFAALVHTYCELLECGLEYAASALLATYRHVYEPTHTTELSDLDLCRTNGHIVDLNRSVSAHTEAVAESRTARSTVHQAKKKKAAALVHAQQNQNNPQQQQKMAQYVAQLDNEIAKYEARYHEATKKASKVSSRLANLPFLRRARALRWQISLSANSYHLLSSFLGRGDGLLLPMSTLLQSRCYINVEKREPVPIVPAVVLEDMFLRGDDDDALPESEKKDSVRWAAPIDPTSRAAEAGEDLRVDDKRSILSRSDPLPFPKFYLDPNAEMSTKEAAEAEKRGVEFNRALLINGFRRLEALECRREYESGMREPSAIPKPVSSTTGKVSSTGAAIVEDDEDDAGEAYREYADPHAPSVLLSTLCAARPSSGPSWSYGTAGGASAAMEGGAAVGSTLLQESGIDICCARLCPPDGRRVAAGCDDAAVRIWTVGDSRAGGSSTRSAGGTNAVGTKGVNDTTPADAVNKPEESAIVLLGHKNGFPIFDLDWNRDGRTLLSAGGDGSIRLWDTAAVGPFGRLANVVKKSHSTGTSSTTLTKSASKEPTTSVPGLRTESMVEVSGAALAAYRGHSPSTPVWSVSFSPSGYYFASAGWDSTARIWTTESPTPVRILAGHFSPSVNSVDWHPNANYVVTAADDKTCRMWDVQTGRCVRLLNGASAGLNLVKVCPSGKYAAASDYSGTVHIWDLGTGRKVNELSISGAQSGFGGTTAVAVQSMSYSACGTALATGGDDCTVRIWDVRGAGSHMSNPEYAQAQGYGEGSSAPTSLPSESQLGRRPIGEQFRLGAREPVKCFRTRRTVIMDLQYTKRNLLLSVGKYSASAM